MTVRERAQPSIIDGSRRKRIARGSGTSVQEVKPAAQAVRRDAPDGQDGEEDGQGKAVGFR